MGVLILSRNVAIYSTRRLTEAFRARNREVTVLDPAAVGVAVGSGKLVASAGGAPLEDPSVAVPRIGHTGTGHALSVLKQLEARGVPLTATSDAIRQSRDKMLCLQNLASEGLPVPPSALVRQPEDAEWAIAAVGGPPVVLKLLEGTHGVGVLLAESREAAKTIIETMQSMEKPLLVQKFVKAADGLDHRLFVVGDRVVAAIRRQAPPGSFRSNLHHGGRAEAFEPDPELAELALRAARVPGLRVAGVDLLLDDDGPLVMELNSSPGIEGIEDATGADIAGEIADEALALEQERRQSPDFSSGRAAR